MFKVNTFGPASQFITLDSICVLNESSRVDEAMHVRLCLSVIFCRICGLPSSLVGTFTETRLHAEVLSWRLL